MTVSGPFGSLHSPATFSYGWGGLRGNVIRLMAPVHNGLNARLTQGRLPTGGFASLRRVDTGAQVNDLRLQNPRFWFQYVQTQASPELSHVPPQIEQAAPLAHAPGTQAPPTQESGRVQELPSQSAGPSGSA